MLFPCSCCCSRHRGTLNSALLPLPQADRRANVSICQEESSGLFPLALPWLSPWQQPGSVSVAGVGVQGFPLSLTLLMFYRRALWSLVQRLWLHRISASLDPLPSLPYFLYWTCWLKKKKNKTPPKSWELHFILLTKLRTSAQDTASQVALRDSSEEAGWSQDIWMFVQQRPGSWDLKSLLVIKENQTSQVREFSAFLSIGSFKSPGWLMLFLGSAPQLSRANVLYFLILSFFRVYSWGDGCSDWLLLAGIQFPAWVSSGLTVGVDLMQWLDGCNVLCLLIQQAMLFIHGVKKLFSGECVCVCVCAHTCVLNCFSHVRIFAILCTVTRQAPLSLRFSRQDYRVGRR